MIITDQFVVLNFPKTGSSFVRKVIKTLYRNKLRRTIFSRLLDQLNLVPKGYEELMLPHPLIPGARDQHGSFSQIPEKHKKKQIVSVIRDPYQRFVSQYRFKWWVEHSGIEEKQINRHFPTFPDISIDEYVVLKRLMTQNMKLHYKIPEEIEIGDQSIQFINMYFESPCEVFGRLSQGNLNGNNLIDDMCNVELLRQENLNEELIWFLKKQGFAFVFLN